jgi:hypothetical protein
MRFKQLLTAIAGTVIMFIYNRFIDDSRLSGLDWITIANMVVGAVGVWWATNGPVGSGLWQYAKTGMMGLSAALTAFLTIIQPNGEIHAPSGSEWWQIAIAVLTAVGVLVVPGPRLVAGDVVVAESTALG